MKVPNVCPDGATTLEHDLSSGLWAVRCTCGFEVGRLGTPEAAEDTKNWHIGRPSALGRDLHAAQPTPAVPGSDPVDTATQWLNLYSDCDISCKQNHPVNHSTVSGLHAAAATARIAAAEYKRERDELQVLVIHATTQLRVLAARSPLPPAGVLLALVTELEVGL